uniref:Uncharacterized protein n=1 Tax=Anguilla anguilla TaxID=7936 RepID=A0A0E9PVK8_ANGAN
MNTVNGGQGIFWC